MAFTRNTEVVTNITSQPDQPIISANALKALFDKSGADEQDYNNDVLLVELEAPTAASSLGQNNGSYGATIQSAIDTITSAGVGTIPPDGTISNLKLATDVKVGSLATLDALLVGFTSSVVSAINKIVAWIGNLTLLNTTDKTSLVNAINEINFNKRYTTTSDFTSSSATLTDVPLLEFDVVSGKTYYITFNGVWKNAVGTSGAKLGVYLKNSGVGTMAGYVQNAEVASAQTRRHFTAIGASGLAGSFALFAQPLTVNVFEVVDAKMFFVCTSSGKFAFQMSSENTDLMTLKTKAFIDVQEV